MLLLLACFADACGDQHPPNTGVVDGELAPCPAKPNCVSSFATDERNKMAPLRYCSPELPARLKLVLSSTEGVKIITETDHYLHAEVTSKIMRFVDDVEFFWDEKKCLLHFRSASRMGYGDFGVNRKRIEAIGSALQKLDKH